MITVMFVCHGNICRSPMGEFILREMVRKQGRAADFLISSCGTSAEELGNPVYPPAARLLNAQGLSCTGKRATQIARDMYARTDYFLGMDARNLTNMKRVFGGDPQHKIHRLLDYTDRPDDIAVPWYTDDYQTAYREIERGCEAFLKEILA